MYTATYSPEDNKLRLYTSTRLDKGTYLRVKAAGFSWAPKQELFVAPAWAPNREDLLVELAGEIGDEDTSLVERAEERAERFEEYKESRIEDAERARDAVSSIADNIPMGQPILIGHHSERRARKDAEKIENGMRRTVKMWETARYWEQRAAGAIRHAKYLERPDVRARRIKGLEADLRKQDKEKQQAEMWLKLWTDCKNETDAELQKGVAMRLASMCWLHLPFKEGDKEGWQHSPTAYDTLEESRHPTLYVARTREEVFAAALETYPRQIAHHERWMAHLTNRLTYERAMMQDSGGTVADNNAPQKGGGCKCWVSRRGGWCYIQKVNKVSVTVLDNWGNGGGNFTRTVPFDKLTGVMSKADVDAKRAAGLLIEAEDGTGFGLLDTPPPAPRPAPSASDERIPDQAELHALKSTKVEVVTAAQLFPTPASLAARMIELAEIEHGQEVLEPSAGTGAIVNAIRTAMVNGKAGRCAITAVEINPTLAHRLAFVDCLGGERVHTGDFLEQNGNLGQFDRVLMNPPFANAEDIKHIKHALTMLKPGGRLVAICCGGPRQERELQPLADTWEELPAGTFADSGTSVNTVLLTITAVDSRKVLDSLQGLLFA